MKQFQSKIIYNNRVCADFFEMAFEWGAEALTPAPGQFLTIRASNDSVPLLRRPFAVAGFDESSGAASIVYQKRGRGTEIMSARQTGDVIDVIGPLGSSFPLGNNLGRAIVVAGGVGLGPILFLADCLRKRGIDTDFIFGCRNESFIPNNKNVANAFSQICTDDGSAGFKGNTVEYISANLNEKLDGKTVIYGCGPLPMLKGLSKLAKSSQSVFWASLEEIMACGTGACMGCAVPAANGGYFRACREGPVFNGEDVQWEQM